MGAATSQISYTASKGGVLAMTRELGVQFAREGVRVNALCPGPVNTPLLQELFAKDPERAARRLVHIPMGRFAEPEEIANAVLFLASDESSFITASTFLVDGGIRGAYVTPLLRLTMVRVRSSGITTYREPARWGVWDDAAPTCCRTRTPTRWRSPAACPCCCRPLAGTAEAASAVVARLDGLVVAGGADVDPARYGERAAPATAGSRRRPRRLGARAARRRRRARPADARGLPRHAGDGRRARAARS